MHLIVSYIWDIKKKAKFASDKENHIASYYETNTIIIKNWLNIVKLI